MGITHQRALDAVVRRWASTYQFGDLVLRGSYITGLLVGRDLRGSDDLDFVALYPFDLERVTRTVSEVLSRPMGDAISFLSERVTTELIFAETEFPGVRFIVPYSSDKELSEVSELQELPVLQIDVAFHDPLSQGTHHQRFAIDGVDTQLQVPCVEDSYAWKLHGLVEFEGLSWRQKDLADLWLLQSHLDIDREKLKHAIAVAFRCRDAPIWRLDRLVSATLGQSRRSRRRWSAHVTPYPENAYPTLGDAVTLVGQFIAPIVGELREGGPFDFVAPPTMSECDLAVNGSKVFRSYPWDPRGSTAGKTFVRERATKALPPRHAPTIAQYRQRLVQRELRGITFDASGNLSARPYAEFEPLSVCGEDEFQTAEVLEKLDGSLVFPTQTCDGWTWRTRRRASDISAAAARFAEKSDANFTGLVEHCFSNSVTPLMEWCSRSRLIVFDHPEDRLVLTGIRKHDSGRLLEYSRLSNLASDFGVEVVKHYSIDVDLKAWVKQVEQWTNSEGCVIRLPDGRQFKIKSDRYKWLHQAVEGPHRDRARWYLWSIGATRQLLDVSGGREIRLDEYIAKLDSMLEQVRDAMLREIKQYMPATQESRKRLAKSVESSLPSVFDRLRYCAFSGRDIDAAWRSEIARQCESQALFRRLTDSVSGPLLQDG